MEDLEGEPRQCANCGNRIWDEKNAKYAKIPTMAVPDRLRKGRNAIVPGRVAQVCALCAIEIDLKLHYHSDPAQHARAQVEPNFSWA